MILLCGCSAKEETSIKVNEPKEYVKAVWITYYELQKFTDGKGKEEFTNSINTAFKELKEMGFNTVTVHVRPSADAFYESDVFPSSRYCFGEQGSEMPYDPLQIMPESAHNNEIKIEAWINPYRVSQDGDTDSLSDNNIAKKWINEKSTNVYVTENGIYFNPASKEVTQLIVEGVTEIVSNYDVDAIHFDDYFYPTTDTDIDEAEYKEYVNNGGNLSLSEFRRDAVSNMIKSVYNKIKGLNSEVEFGVSPSADIDKNYNELYADVEKWCSEDGYIDYICPQVYFGFKNEVMPFMQTVKRWTSISKCTLYVGLPLYKCGKEDKYASIANTESINEFKDNTDIISRQVIYLLKLTEVKGYYIFSYSCLFSEDCKEETDNLLSLMQGSSPN